MAAAENVQEKNNLKKGLDNRFRIVFYIVLILTGYIFLPVYLEIRHLEHLKSIFLFYLASFIVTFFIFRAYSKKKGALEYKLQELDEKINIVSEQNLKEIKNNASLNLKIERYKSLKRITEEINQKLELDSVVDNLTSSALSIVSGDKGVCLLYLADSVSNTLNLFASKKEDSHLVIKAKEGDVFDFWVLKHSSPLLIEDTRKDFRFDLEKITPEDSRPIGSLISSPLISEHRFLGILRLDSPETHFYSQEDLRLLVKISELGAVALENSQLFQKTEDLAVHDGLTGLFTKGYFLQRLRQECKKGLRKDSLFSLLMLDIDFFKNYNDKFGHTAGDIVLKKISALITDSLKEFSSLVCRFGGEEFCVILDGVNKNNALKVAESLRKKIENEKIILRREPTSITVSIGLASFPVDATEPDNIIQKADKAMYEAKQQGRNRVCSA